MEHICCLCSSAVKPGVWSLVKICVWFMRMERIVRSSIESFFPKRSNVPLRFNKRGLTKSWHTYIPRFSPSSFGWNHNIQIIWIWKQLRKLTISTNSNFLFKWKLRKTLPKKRKYFRGFLTLLNQCKEIPLSSSRGRRSASPPTRGLSTQWPQPICCESPVEGKD